MIADHFRASGYSPIITPFVPAPSLTGVASYSRVQLGVRNLPPSTSPQAEWNFGAVAGSYLAEGVPAVFT